MNIPIFVRQLKQIDNYTFAIEWSDGKKVFYRLSTLQKKCPCANCVDESTGQRTSNANNISETLRANRIVNVGRYALRIEFASGCSSGIYGYDMLYDLT
ncbi:MAG: DUF971 domain-containing protein [Parachlamydiaceae bacterium]|nr:DUF971 domain-containing protein [Parachlamydiaceae bacterium]